MANRRDKPWMRSLRLTQRKLEAAERREDWVAVLRWDRAIDALTAHWYDAVAEEARND